MKPISAEQYRTFCAYGELYVQYFIIDRHLLHDYMGINRPDFEHRLQLADCPPFDPVHDLRADDEDGRLYRAAFGAAWEKLLVALYEPGAFYDDELDEDELDEYEDEPDVEDWYR